jgi:hypothetical protein
MTAPCYRRAGDDDGTVDCLCPNFEGPYQIGQTLADPQQCDIGDQNVWSAAYNVNATDAERGGSGVELTATTPTPEDCIPDDPNPDVGCPLLPEEGSFSDDFDQSGELCQQVCHEYSQCTRNEIEIGYTCDATLCTVGCNDLGLAGEACSGLADCQTDAILQLEAAAGCSCCASQICGCEPNAATNAEITVLNDLQREVGIEPQCDLNGTLCGEPAR